MMGISPWQLLILLAVVILLFGTKRLRNVGSDVGSAIKGFRESMDDEKKEDEKLIPSQPPAEKTQAEEKEKDQA